VSIAIDFFPAQEALYKQVIKKPASYEDGFEMQ
jgi:hypothetical protein